jgi:hypothetical protein
MEAVKTIKKKPSSETSFAQRCRRRAIQCLCLGGALHALIASGLCVEAGDIVSGLPYALAFLALRIALPILLLVAAVELIIRRIGEFVTPRWDRLMRK